MHSFHDKYVLGEKLGEGQHAIVFKCYQRATVKPSSDGCTPLPARDIPTSDYLPTPFAVKIVRDDDSEKIDAHEREFSILKKLDHRNVVRAVESFSDKFKHKFYQVMEFINGQEILDEIAESGGYTEQAAQGYYRQILEAISYLHQ